MNANANTGDQTLDSAMDLLDETIDDLADAPENKPFPNGVHRVEISVALPPADDKGVVKPGVRLIKIKYLEQLELVDPETPEEELSRPNDTNTIWIHTIKKDGKKNEYGEGDYKKIAKPLSIALGAATTRELIEATAKQGVEAVIVTKIQKSRDPKYSDSMRIEKIEVL